ncbi:MAG: hypothetical protein LBS97_01390 [Treponema sp.]|jgi:hypothetical protein|nr:hypothetical protein [Treponema sp.]
MTSNEKEEIQNAERKAAAEVRAWKRKVSKKLNKMTSSERILYFNEKAAKYSAERGWLFM